MEKSIIKFGDIEIEKQKLHGNKRPNIHINKRVVSNKASLEKRVLNISSTIKMLKIRPLCIFLPK